MNYVEAPDPIDNTYNTLFLAGGISDCPDWQMPVAKLLQKHTDLCVLNPRRAGKDKDDIDPMEQITWEFNALKRSDYIMFWFPKESICPIALFECGKWIMKNKTLFIGCDPDYPRKLDLEVQLQLQRPDLTIYYSLKDLSREIIKFANA